MKNLYRAYNLAQLLTWPLWLLPLLAKKRRSLALKRLFPPSLALSRPVIWVHALSVGEIQAARGLLKALKAEFSSATVVLSVTTSSGFSFACRHLRSEVEVIFPAPLDLRPIVQNFVKTIQPEAYILVETDVWPNLLWSLRQKGTQVFMVNAAISQKAYKRLRKWPSLARFLYDPFELLTTATEDDAKRFQALLPEKPILYLGNLKFDLALPEVSKVKQLFKELGPYLVQPVIVCGSTHPGEEELLLKAFKLFGQGSLILCPRHPERAHEVEDLARKQGFPTARRSRPQPCRVLVVDTLGELRALYALGETAFVGGSLVPLGGHNLLEPACLGVPVTFGPYHESVRNLAKEFQRQGAGLEVPPDPQAIATAWKEITKKRKSMSEAAEKLFFKHQGVAPETAALIRSSLSKHR